MVRSACFQRLIGAAALRGKSRPRRGVGRVHMSLWSDGPYCPCLNSFEVSLSDLPIRTRPSPTIRAAGSELPVMMRSTTASRVLSGVPSGPVPAFRLGRSPRSIPGSCRRHGPVLPRTPPCERGRDAGRPRASHRSRGSRIRGRRAAAARARRLISAFPLAYRPLHGGWLTARGST